MEAALGAGVSQERMELVYNDLRGATEKGRAIHSTCMKVGHKQDERQTLSWYDALIM